jgi:hypothetical protein
MRFAGVRRCWFGAVGSAHARRLLHDLVRFEPEGPRAVERAWRREAGCRACRRGSASVGAPVWRREDGCRAWRRGRAGAWIIDGGCDAAPAQSRSRALHSPTRSDGDRTGSRARPGTPVVSSRSRSLYGTALSHYVYTRDGTVAIISPRDRSRPRSLPSNNRRGLFQGELSAACPITHGRCDPVDAAHAADPADAAPGDNSQSYGKDCYLPAGSASDVNSMTR